MKPFAVSIDEKFVKLNIAPRGPRRYRVDFWFKFEDGEKIDAIVTTKKPITFGQLVDEVITPEINKMTKDFTSEPISTGFSCYLWG